jgi:23S rRNA (cytosine1962-C5)-methyltransferase
MSDPKSSRPTIPVTRRAAGRIVAGHPWVFANEVTARLPDYAPGQAVDVVDPTGRSLASGYVNPSTLIAIRITGRAGEGLDGAWLRRRLERARAYRERVLPDPRFGRLLFAESDGVPGLVIDRYDDVYVVQVQTAGMVALQSEVVAALTEQGARAVVLANDSSYRELEGLERERRLAHGSVEGPVDIEEHGLRFQADVVGGQKTGYYYDQRDNRARFASLVKGGEVLDLFCYTGSWSIAAARNGAQVIGRDSSAAALEQARRHAESRRFAAVVLDPPPLAKNRKSRPAALRAMVRLVRDAAVQVSRHGVLVVCSCSHHIGADDLTDAVATGLAKGRREGRIMARGGQAPDHPVLPPAPETSYLHALFIELD